MSRHTPAASPSSHAAGRHRLGSASGVRCADIPAVRERMEFQRPAVAHRSSLLRWMFSTPTTGRHTWSFLAGSGGRPRTAFAIILSL
ncbi:hypothetical protein SAMN04515665_112127 [Blastococcus sp. DSM 46786]|uniref:hypothetical protein n=1 Tax=Blastococcus sp. DSM 46786 TaxID=1798227 RepID=UPI0008C8FE6E|nr:hypothetical protein [Blastococcus sp. DSM 46786]SEL43246.1 hypothetical protein SAMN04515665_112127 [Blastococcus sp. DSM 46786]